MTLIEVAKRVAEIKGLVSDPEAAHSKEDDLYRDVLNWLSHRNHLTVDPGLAADIALTALHTQRLKFCRWCV